MKKIRLLSRCLSFVVLCMVFQARADVDSLLNEYKQNANDLAQQCDIVKKNAPSCGFIGGQIAGHMDPAVGKAALNSTIAAVGKGRAGIPTLNAQVASMNEENSNMESRLDTIRYALSTESPSCKKASVAFEQMRKLALASPGKLKSIVAALQN